MADYFDKKFGAHFCIPFGKANANTGDFVRRDDDEQGKVARSDCHWGDDRGVGAGVDVAGRLF